MKRIVFFGDMCIYSIFFFLVFRLDIALVNDEIILCNNYRSRRKADTHTEVYSKLCIKTYTAGYRTEHRLAENGGSMLGFLI